MVFVYGDYLYLHSSKPAFELRDRFIGQMVSHKNAFIKLLLRDKRWINKAFSFATFGQLVINNSNVYQQGLEAVQKMYKTDKTFINYVQDDCSDTGHQVGDREVNFILEEITMLYLTQKGVFGLGNNFVTDTEVKWILQVYPGKPLKSEIYLFQKNPLKLSNPKNQYENSYYDLEEQVLYDYLKEG